MSFADSDLGPTFEIPVLADDTGGALEAFKRTKFVTIHEDRNGWIARSSTTQVLLSVRDPRHRARLRTRLREPRSILRLRLSLHAAEAGMLAGTLLVTQPRAVETVEQRLVVAMDESHLDHWREKAPSFGLQDVGRELSIPLPASDRYRWLMLQTSVLAGDQDEAQLVTSQGFVLCCRFETEGGRARLAVHRVEPPRPRSKLDASVPLVRFGGMLVGAAGVDVVAPDADSWMSRAALESLRAPRDPLLDSWVSYHEIERDLEKLRVKARGQGLWYEDATPAGGNEWRASIRTTAELLAPWLPEEWSRNKPVSLRQTAQVVQNGDPLDFEVEIRELSSIERDQGVARVRLAVRDGSALPNSGRLVPVASRGDAHQRRRRLEAATRLVRGEMANDGMGQWLVQPSRARVPRRRTLAAGGRLNSAQRRAVEAALGSEDVVLVQGPPGTGKTQVIVEVLEHLWRERERERGRGHEGDDDPGPLRVLVSAVQNDAVANVAEKLRRTGTAKELLIHEMPRKERRDEAMERSRQRGVQEAKNLIVRDDGESVVEAVRALEELAERTVVLDAATANAIDDDVWWGEVARSLAALLSEPAFENELDAFRLEGHALRSRAEGWGAPQSDDPAISEHARALLEALSLDLGSDAVVRVRDLAAAHPEAASVMPGNGSGLLKVMLNQLARAPDMPERVAGLWRPLSEMARGQLLALTTVRDDSLGDELLRWSAAVRQASEARVRNMPASAPLVRHRLARALERSARAWADIEERYSTVVAGTCQKIGGLHWSMNDPPYDYAIIDEAGRASPLDLLIVMTRARRTLLVGDQRQLPPTVEEMIAEQVRAGRDSSVDMTRESLFSRLFERVPTTNRVALDVQYRMHETIGTLVSKLFYDGTLHSHFSGELARERLPSFGLYENAPLVWVDTSESLGGRECVESNVVELAEIDWVLRTIEELDEAGRLEPERGKSFGLISFYSEQKKRIDELVERHPRARAHVEVGTVDSFQGKEYPVVVLSTVKHSRHGRVGFLHLPNRINVAFSRAQRQLVILGSSTTFAMHRRDRKLGSKYLHEACEHAKRHGLFVSARRLT